MRLDPDLAAQAIETDVGRPLGLDPPRAAAAVLRLATENMVGAIEEITIHQGLDPRGTILIGGGGAAGINSVAIARRLGCAKVVIPEMGAALSAVGALISDLHADYRALFFTSTRQFDCDGANAVLDQLTEKCRAFIDGPGAGAVESTIEYFAEARYRAQIWEIDLPLGRARFDGAADVERIREDFDRLHEQVFAFRDPDSDVEFVGWRAVARCRLSDRSPGGLSDAVVLEAAPPAPRQAYFGGEAMIETPVAYFGQMQPGVPLAGPAIIESPFTTVVVEPGSVAVRTVNGSLVITP